MFHISSKYCATYFCNISFCIFIHMIHIYKWRGVGTIYVFCKDIIELSMIYVMLNANAILKARYSAQSTCQAPAAVNSPLNLLYYSAHHHLELSEVQPRFILARFVNSGIQVDVLLRKGVPFVRPMQRISYFQNHKPYSYVNLQFNTLVFRADGTNESYMRYPCYF